MDRSLLVSTPLGDLRFGAQVDGAQTASRLVLTTVPITPALPLGMAVDGCVGVVLASSAAVPHGLRFDCAWSGDPPTPMSPATGEGLDAQEWSNSEHVVLIGTEDAETLRVRLGPKLVFGESPDPYFVEYRDTGLRIKIDEVPARAVLTLHFVVAWNRLPEPKDCSCWYAVDVRHETLLSSAQPGCSAP